MAGLVPFNKKSKEISTGSDFNDFYNMLDDFFTEGWPFRRSLMGDTFKIDVQDCGNEYIVEAELPGVQKNEVNLDFEDGKLRISISKTEETEKNKKNYIHRERRYSSMVRNIFLEYAKPDGIVAKLDDGVLSITVPKQEKPENLKRIPIE